MEACVDCGDPSARDGRCVECLEEVAESPDWRDEAPAPSVSQDDRRSRLAACGHTVPMHRGRQRPRCPDCVTTAPRVPAACGACGVDLPPLRHQGNPRRWCSRSCMDYARRNPGVVRPIDWRTRADWRKPRPCEQCETDFVPALKSTRFCSMKCVGAYQKARSAERRPECSEGCGKPARVRGMCRTHYNKATGHYIGAVAKDPERERARLRIKTHRRKDWSRLTDITPEYEMALRAKAKRCPLCEVKLTDEPYLPNSKELDHIVPRNVGGTHTIGNVRMICRHCNITRPWDGSDYTGPVTLWAEVA